MAKESSFDIVSTVDMQEVDNAFQQARKELAQRYDLKDSGAEISLDKSAGTLTVTAPADFVASQVIDVIGSKLIKRGIELTAVKWGDSTPSSGGGVRRCATVVNGIDKEVVVVGNTGRFEIWDADRFKAMSDEVDLGLFYS